MGNLNSIKNGVLSIARKVKDGSSFIWNELSGKNAYNDVIESAKKLSDSAAEKYNAVAGKLKEGTLQTRDIVDSLKGLAKQNTEETAKNAQKTMRNVYISAGLFGVAPVGVSMYAAHKANQKTDKRFDELSEKLENLNKEK